MKTNLFKRVYTGALKGFKTSTLPDHIKKFQSNPFIRILRVLGGLSIIILISTIRFKYSLPLFIMYTLLAMGFLFLIYHIYISYHRIRNIIRLLKSDELDIRNSPLDRLATLVARTVVCAKGLCDSAQPIGYTIGLMMGIDALLINSGDEAIFSPIIASTIKKVIPLNPREQTLTQSFIKKSFDELKANTETSELISKLSKDIESDRTVLGLSKEEFAEFQAVLKECRENLDNNSKATQSKILEAIGDVSSKFKK
jgi:hypothetical protein